VTPLVCHLVLFVSVRKDDLVHPGKGQLVKRSNGPNDILRWATGTNAVRGRILSELAAPIYPAARGGSDPKSSAQAASLTWVTHSLARIS
jgi:hypothetical protein